MVLMMLLSSVILGYRRFVTLKVTVADLLDSSREACASVLKLIAENSATDVEPGSQHVLGLLDNLQIEGPNGTHQALVTEVFASLSDLKGYPICKNATYNLILTSLKN